MAARAYDDDTMLLFVRTAMIKQLLELPTRGDIKVRQTYYQKHQDTEALPRGCTEMPSDLFVDLPVRVDRDAETRALLPPE